MKVGLFIGHVQPTDGGAYTFIVELLAGLERMVGICKHDLVICHNGCEVVANQFPGLSALDLKRHKPKVLNLCERLFDVSPERLETLYRRILRLKFKPRWDQQIYLQEGIQFVLQLWPLAAPKFDIPYGAIVWDLAHRNLPCFPEVGSHSTWVWRQNNNELLVGRASLIYTGTKRGRRELEHYFQIPSERIVTLMVPTPSFAIAAAGRPARRDILRSFDVAKEYLFYPAQFWAHKNHVAILEACKLVRDQTSWDLGIVFTGSDKGNREYVRGYARRLGLGDACRFLDFVDQDELVELYKGAFCLTYATFFGPDNLPPLEAFALGCPVVASAVPGSEEQLGDAALLFAPQDEQALAQHILALRDSDLRSQLVAKGYKQARARLTWDEYARGLIDSVDEFASIRRAWL